MIATFFVALLVIGKVYCKSLPPQQILPEIDAESSKGNIVILRNTRQSGGSEYIFHPNVPDTNSNPSLYPQQQQRKPPEQKKQVVNWYNMGHLG